MRNEGDIETSYPSFRQYPSEGVREGVNRVKSGL